MSARLERITISSHPHALHLQALDALTVVLLADFCANKGASHCLRGAHGRAAAAVGVANQIARSGERIDH